MQEQHEAEEADQVTDEQRAVRKAARASGRKIDRAVIDTNKKL
jgi:hypothetical protein